MTDSHPLTVDQRSRLWRWDSRPLSLVIVLASVGTLLLTKLIFARAFIDLHVYVEAGKVFARHGDLYGAGFGQGLGTQLAYTYPPLMAAVMVLVAWLPWFIVASAWTLANVLLLVWVVRLSYKPLLARLGPKPLVGVAVLVGVLSFMTPVTDVLYLGQVGLALMALVLADTLPEATRLPRGVLVGIAAAVKLTPVAFVGYWIVVGRWRAAATATLTALALWLSVALLFPDASREYWRGAVFDTKRMGDVSTYINQSLKALLLRAGEPSQVLWAALAGVAMIGALLLARLAHRRGDELAAVTTIGLGTLLASPVSWTHHAVWVIPATGLLLADGRSRRRLMIWVAVVGVLALRIPEVGQSVERHPGLHVLGLWLENCYVAVFMLLLIYVPTRCCQSDPSLDPAVRRRMIPTREQVS